MIETIKVDTGTAGTVKTLVIRYLRKASNLQIQRQMFLRRIGAFLSQYSMSQLDMLDLVNWFSQFR
ncbi:hypothetical protein L873DRAFT_1809511 [Choiromyces venosus 120613-1]|uniref:Uncharacterized protein n=1 Tax=Choiromyces venosus 120613-1 TaxID=1336337 RepID=A0A3N4JK91_9PEZI|nr:hypothetical protein L873DRAFT_1809511 [Choiromyces venosus 120613-1]